MKRVIAGYASLFNAPDLAGDEILKGAFEKTLAKRDRPIAMLYQHDATRPIGHWTSLSETPRGLWVEGVLGDGVQLADEVAALIEQNMLRGLSIGFRARRSSPGRGRVRRHLHEIDLVEISIVTFPMQPLAGLVGQMDEVPKEEQKTIPTSLTQAAHRLRQISLSRKETFQ